MRVSLVQGQEGCVQPKDWTVGSCRLALCTLVCDHNPFAPPPHLPITLAQLAPAASSKMDAQVPAPPWLPKEPLALLWGCLYMWAPGPATLSRLMPCGPQTDQRELRKLYHINEG